MNHDLEMDSKIRKSKYKGYTEESGREKKSSWRQHFESIE